MPDLSGPETCDHVIRAHQIKEPKQKNRSEPNKVWARPTLCYEAIAPIWQVCQDIYAKLQDRSLTRTMLHNMASRIPLFKEVLHPKAPLNRVDSRRHSNSASIEPEMRVIANLQF